MKICKKNRFIYVYKKYLKVQTYRYDIGSTNLLNYVRFYKFYKFNVTFLKQYLNYISFNDGNFLAVNDLTYFVGER